MLNGFGLLLGVGGATMYNIHRSRKEAELANQAYTNMIALGAILSVIGIAIGWTLASPLAHVLGAQSSDVHGITTTYLRTLMTFTPCFIFNYIFVAFMRNDNAPRFSTICMVTGTLTNIALDYIFIYPLNLGMLGAALATGISPLVGMVLALILYVLPKKVNFHLCRCKLSPSLMVHCCGLGTSSFIGEISTSVVIIVSNLVILGLAGDIGVAAYGVIANLTCVVVAIFNGVIQGGQPLISNYYALGKRKEEHQTLRLCIVTSVILGALWWISALLFAPQITAVFNSEHNATLAAIAIPGLRIYFAGFLLSGVNLSFMKRKSGQLFFLKMGWALVSHLVYLLHSMEKRWLAFAIYQTQKKLKVNRELRFDPLLSWRHGGVRKVAVGVACVDTLSPIRYHTESGAKYMTATLDRIA